MIGQRFLPAGKGFVHLFFFITLWFVCIPEWGRGQTVSPQDAHVHSADSSADDPPGTARPKHRSRLAIAGPAHSSNQASGPVTLETRWDSMWGMKYFQDGQVLSGPRLRSLLQSAKDPAINGLIDRYEQDETLGTIGLGASIVASVSCLALPSTQIHLGSLNIAAPYLPLQIPALAIGLVAAFLTNAAGAARYEAVQRYNASRVKPSSVTWSFSPASDHWIFGFKYCL